MRNQKAYHVHISRGCVGKCSYCAIKVAKGNLKSRPISDIVKDFTQCVELGARTIYLETEDLGCYGLDIQKTVIQLLRAIFAVKGNYRVILHDFNPQWLLRYFSELFEIIADNKNKIALITIPVQSASNRILSLMNRPYEIEPVQECISQLIRMFPRLEIRLHILVGFPGETEEDFRKTLAFLRWVNQYKRVEVWYAPYSERKVILAAQLPGKLSKESILERLGVIKKTVRRSILDPKEIVQKI